MTPDSSRFWPLAGLRAGQAAALVRQAVCARLVRRDGLGQDRPGARAPRERRRRDPRALRRGLRAAHRELVRRVSRRPGDRARMRATVLVRPEGRDPRSTGRGGSRLAPEARLRRGWHPRRARRRHRARCDRPGVRPRAGRAHVLRAPRKSLDRERRDPAGRASDGTPASSPSSSSPARTTIETPAWALGALGADIEYVWHEDEELPEATGAVVLPGGFSYGDYLRCGAIASVAPAMDAVRRFAASGGPVLGICNGFQILCEARLLPGVLAPEPTARVRLQRRDGARRERRHALHSPLRIRPGARPSCEAR